VRYVLEGSVQRDQNHVRVNAQLIDPETGAHLWAERFEENMADVFKLQDQVVARLANTLGSELVKAEAEKSTHSGNPDAIDLTMRGWAILNQAQLYTDKANLAAALDLFERASKFDPNNVDALVGAALSERDYYVFGGMDDKPEQIS
jgi:adenylate cyclase